MPIKKENDVEETLILQKSNPAVDFDLDTIAHKDSPPSCTSVHNLAPLHSSQLETLVSSNQTLPLSKIENRFGDYELVSEIARGGMGVVYKARQPRLNRTVAIKMILAGQLASDVEIKRFHLEATAAAQLDHSGIVPIYEVGELQGQHFFSMAFIEGKSLQEQLKQGPLTPFLAAELIGEVATAVHFAHSKGIIHRDLKPHNILLDSNGRPKLTDFGLAKCADSVDGLTATGDIMGTPSYMSPEQASGKTHDLGVPADVYSLGAILYATLTGRPPFQAASLVETLRQVVEQEPVPPTLLNRSVPRDLETICLKCLQKEPTKRYESAALLTEDLRRFCRSEPILARPVGRVEVAWRWCWRNPALSSAIAFSACALLGVTALAMLMYLKEANYASTLNEEVDAKQEALAKAEKLREIADNESQVAKEQTAIAEQKSQLAQERLGQLRRETTRLMLERGVTLCEYGEISKGVLWQARALESAVQAESTELESVTRKQIGAWQQRIHPWQDSFEHSGTIYACDLSDDGKYLAIGGTDRQVQIWDIESRTRVGSPMKFAGTVHSIAFQQTGNLLAIGGDGFGVKLFNLKTKQFATVPFEYVGRVYSVAFDPLGKSILAAGTGGRVRRWSTSTGKEFVEDITVTGNVLCAAYSPDGSRIVLGTSPNGRGDAVYSGQVIILDAETGKELYPPLIHPGGVHAIVFHPNGKTFYTGCYEQKVRQYDVSTGALVSTPVTHCSQIFSLAISKDGKSLLIGGRDYIAQLYDLTTEKPVGQPLMHRDAVWTNAISLDGRSMFTAGGENHVDMWRIAKLSPMVPAMSTGSKSGGIAISPDGNTVYVADQSHRAARKWDSKTGKFIGNAHKEDICLYCVATSHDGLKLVTGPTEYAHARIWDATSGEPIGMPMPHQHHVRNVCFSRDDRFVATASFDHTARVWDANSGLPVTPPLQHGDFVWQVKFSPDAKTLYTCGEDRMLRRWDVATGNPIEPSLVHPAEVFSLDISNDGRFAITACRDHLVRFWDLENGTLNGIPIVCGTEVRCAVFNQSGDTIMTGCRDGSVQLWDNIARRPIGAPILHPNIVDMVLFHPSDQSILTWCRDGNARLWAISQKPIENPDRVRQECETLAGMKLGDNDLYYPLTIEQRREAIKTQ